MFRYNTNSNISTSIQSILTSREDRVRILIVMHPFITSAGFARYFGLFDNMSYLT